MQKRGPRPAVEKTLRGKVQKQTFPPSLEIPQKARDSHFPTAPTTADVLQRPCPKTQTRRKSHYPWTKNGGQVTSLMPWNWQQPDWPNFTWNKSRLAQAEQQFLVGAGTLMGAVKHLDGEERSHITIETISTEAVTTAEIEGEILDRASVQSSIRRQFGLATDNRRVGPAEQGMAEMMVDLYRSFAVPLSGE